MALTLIKVWGGTNDWTNVQQAADYFPLLNHSDCDGELSVEECEKTIRALGIIVTNIGDDLSKLDFTERRMRDSCLTFISGCIEAKKKGEPIIFS